MFTSSGMRLTLAVTVLALGVAGVVLGIVLGNGATGPTKAQYVRRADAICRTAASQTAPLIKQIPAAAAALATGGSGAASQLATLVGSVHADAASALVRLRALARPSADRAAIGSFLRPLASVTDAMGGAGAALRGSQPLQALTLLQRMQPAAQRAASAARAYGMTDCAHVLAPLG